MGVCHTKVKDGGAATAEKEHEAAAAAGGGGGGNVNAKNAAENAPRSPAAASAASASAAAADGFGGASPEVGGGGCGGGNEEKSGGGSGGSVRETGSRSCTALSQAASVSKGSDAAAASRSGPGGRFGFGEGGRWSRKSSVADADLEAEGGKQQLQQEPTSRTTTLRLSRNRADALKTRDSGETLLTASLANLQLDNRNGSGYVDPHYGSGSGSAAYASASAACGGGYRYSNHSDGAHSHSVPRSTSGSVSAQKQASGSLMFEEPRMRDGVGSFSMACEDDEDGPDTNSTCVPERIALPLGNSRRASPNGRLAKGSSRYGSVRSIYSSELSRSKSRSRGANKENSRRGNGSTHGGDAEAETGGEAFDALAALESADLEAEAEAYVHDLTVDGGQTLFLGTSIELDQSDLADLHNELHHELNHDLLSGSRLGDTDPGTGTQARPALGRHRSALNPVGNWRKSDLCHKSRRSASVRVLSLGNGSGSGSQIGMAKAAAPQPPPGGGGCGGSGSERQSSGFNRVAALVGRQLSIGGGGGSKQKLSGGGSDGGGRKRTDPNRFASLRNVKDFEKKQFAKRASARVPIDFKSKVDKHANGAKESDHRRWQQVAKAGNNAVHTKALVIDAAPA